MGMPVEAIITGFYSTHVINMISWNKAYAVFPQATFIDRRGIILQALNDNRVSFLQKYIRRGFSFSRDQAKAMLAVEQDRRVADGHSWVIHLDTVGIAGPSLQDWSLEYAGIKLKKSSLSFADRRISEIELERYNIEMVRVKSKVLRREYLCASHPWAQFLADQADRASGIELARADANARSLGRQGRSRNIHPPPADAAFYDDEIPTWFAQWQELQVSKAAPAVDVKLRARLYRTGAAAELTPIVQF